MAQPWDEPELFKIVMKCDISEKHTKMSEKPYKDSSRNKTYTKDLTVMYEMLVPLLFQGEQTWNFHGETNSLIYIVLLDFLFEQKVMMHNICECTVHDNCVYTYDCEVYKATVTFPEGRVRDRRMVAFLLGLKKRAGEKSSVRRCFNSELGEIQLLGLIGKFM